MLIIQLVDYFYENCSAATRLITMATKFICVYYVEHFSFHRSLAVTKLLLIGFHEVIDEPLLDFKQLDVNINAEQHVNSLKGLRVGTKKNVADCSFFCMINSM